MHSSYALLDSGSGRKLERFGPYTIVRPAPQIFTKAKLPQEVWDNADASFSPEKKEWSLKRQIPESWNIEIDALIFKLKLTDFGHLGIFPEQRSLWQWIQNNLREKQAAQSDIKQPIKVLNLFAYSGGSTLAAAKEGAEVCHVDASKSMVAWAKSNAELNHLEPSIRWIIDDVSKFLQRELRRGTKYDAFILDPPSFGRGPNGEIFKIEQHLNAILSVCKKLLSDHPLFVLLTCHTPEFNQKTLKEIIRQMMQSFSGHIEDGELFLKGDGDTTPLPCGTFARWKA